MRCFVCILFFFCLLVQKLNAQSCSGRKGHSPSTALSICGNGTYSQPPSISCFNANFFLPGCTNSNTSYGDLNPVYFKFTCRASGTLAFTIAPRSPADNINWQLFDITGNQPDDIYTSQANVVAANWSGTLGLTGASAGGSVHIQCRTLATDGNINTFSPLIQIQQSHTYLLMVSNLTHAGDFALTITGGTADISDNEAQQIQVYSSNCSNDEVEISFSRPVQCSSISPNASEINITPSVGPIQIVGLNCNNSNETETIRLKFLQTPPAGTYNLSINNGADGNTLMDNCNNLLQAGMNINFSIQPYAIIDTIITDSCIVSSIKLNLSKNVLCSSIAADGSDFQIAGSSSILITSAAGNCPAGTTNTIELKLSQPVQQAGTYLVILKNGTDGNTLIDNCSITTPIGLQKSFTISQPVNANFSLKLQEGCTEDTLLLSHAAANGETKWLWTVDTLTSTFQNPSFILRSGGNYTAQLITYNRNCSARSQQNFVVNEKLFADFSIPTSVCTGEAINVQNQSRAATGWIWDFGNGTSSNDENPPTFQYASLSDQIYTVSLTVYNSNCSVATSKLITVSADCNVYVPTAFTPNNDGLNDTFGPSSSNQLQNYQFTVFNRYGQRIFVSASTQIKWDGYWKGILQSEGQYIWLMTYTDKKTGKTITRRGTMILIL